MPGNSIDPVIARLARPATPLAETVVNDEQPLDRYEHQQVTKKSAYVSAGVIGALGLGLIYALKNGINEGFTKIGHFTNSVSNLIAVPLSFLFPLLLLDNERASLRNESKGKDDIFARTTYTMASLAFTPLTFGDQLITATRSKGHMAATILNLPHTLYSLFSYTGGRLMGFATALKMRFNKDPLRKYRLEQEFEAFYTLGNLGSAQCSIIPMAGQFITGWQNIFDIFKGDFGSAWERVKEEPVSATLGTCFNAFLWPFEYFSKVFDTTVRTAETVESFENAFPKDSRIIKLLKGLRDKFHNSVENQDSGLGCFLKTGRRISMNLSTYIPPIGMASVVLPVMNKYFRGEMLNAKAQEVGGLTGFFDKIFSTGACLGHFFYTGLYALVVRGPQSFTHAMFYITRLVNKITGKNHDPEAARNWLTNFAPFKAVSNWAAKRLDKLELGLHPNKPILIEDQKDENGNVIVKGQGRNRNIRTRSEVIVQEICMIARERLYKEVVAQKMPDVKLGTKAVGVKPSDEQWGLIIANPEIRERLIKDSETMFREYLSKTEMLDPDKADKYMNKYYWGNGLNRTDKFGRERKPICDEVVEQIDSEIHKCSSTEPIPEEQQNIKSKNLVELLTHPSELLEILKLKTFHLTNTFLMLWVNGFVNSSDFGDPQDEFWERDLNVKLFAIRELDTQQACNREFMPVVMYGWQSMSKGLLLMRGMKRALFNGESIADSTDYEPQYSIAG